MKFDGFAGLPIHNANGLAVVSKGIVVLAAGAGFSFSVGFRS